MLVESWLYSGTAAVWFTGQRWIVSNAGERRKRHQSLVRRGRPQASRLCVTWGGGPEGYCRRGQINITASWPTRLPRAGGRTQGNPLFLWHRGSAEAGRGEASDVLSGPGCAPGGQDDRCVCSGRGISSLGAMGESGTAEAGEVARRGGEVVGQIFGEAVTGETP